MVTKNEFKKERTRIISEMLDNPNEVGIYPTTKCFEQLDELYDKIASELAKGGQEMSLTQNKIDLSATVETTMTVKEFLAKYGNKLGATDDLKRDLQEVIKNAKKGMKP